MNPGGKNFALVLYESQCSNNCVFCGGKRMGDIAGNIKKELDKIDIALKEGETIKRVEISGNDPCEYEKLSDFVSLVKNKTSASEIILISNGKSLSNKKFLKKIVKSGVNHFIIPFYGHVAKIHDSVTRTAGSFKATYEGVKNIYSLRQNVSFQCLITRENQKYLKELFNFLSKLSFYEFSRVGIPCYLEGDKNFPKSIPDFLKLRSQLTDALKLCQHINFDLQLFDIPRCFIDFHYKNIVENALPRKGYDHLAEREMLPLGSKDGQIIPEYRIKKKINLCKKCIYNNSCPGFFKTYVDSGIFLFRPRLK